MPKLINCVTAILATLAVGCAPTASRHAIQLGTTEDCYEETASKSSEEQRQADRDALFPRCDGRQQVSVPETRGANDYRSDDAIRVGLSLECFDLWRAQSFDTTDTRGFMRDHWRGECLMGNPGEHPECEQWLVFFRDECPALKHQIQAEEQRRIADEAARREGERVAQEQARQRKEAREQRRIDDEAARREGERVAQEQARQAKERGEREQKEAAAHVTRCQADLDSGDIDNAKACWTERDWSNTYPAYVTDKVVSCLDGLITKITEVTACLKLPQATDDNVWNKGACLSKYSDGTRTTPTCGPLTTTAFLAKAEANIDLSTKTAAFEKKKLKPLQDRCGSPHVVGLLTYVSLGHLDEAKAIGCEYFEHIVYAKYFTADNWLVVDFEGEAAVRTKRKVSRGGSLRGVRLRFLGLKRFTLTNGTAGDMPAFLEIK